MARRHVCPPLLMNEEIVALDFFKSQINSFLPVPRFKLLLFKIVEVRKMNGLRATK